MTDEKNSVRLNYSIAASYKDSFSKVNYSNSRSKKKGSSIREFEYHAFKLGFFFIADWKVLEEYENGNIDREVNEKRLTFVKSNGLRGFSRTDAIRFYKYVFSRIPLDKIDLSKTFDTLKKEDLFL